MTDNKTLKRPSAVDVPIIERAQERLKKAHLQVLRKGRGGWRAVAKKRGVNVKYVYELATRGVVPPNPDTRRKLGLPRVMPSERKPRARRETVKLGAPGWEAQYFKKVGKQ